MIFDILFIVLLIAAIAFGYNKGIVSFILSLGLIVVSFVLSMYISYRWNYVDVPVFGMWIQTFILFAILSGISRWLVSMIDFEEIAVVGFFSRILGAALYGVVFSVIALIVVTIILVYVTPDFNVEIFSGSMIIEWLKGLISKLDLIQFELPELIRLGGINMNFHSPLVS